MPTKKALLIALATLALAACSGGSSEASCENQYWDGTVGTCLPANWKVVDRATLDQRSAPPEVIVAFQAEKPVSGQFPTVTVTREALKTAMSSPDYSAASIQSVSTLPGYEEGSQSTVKIDDANVKMHMFSAQPLPDQPRTKFYQVSIAGKGAGFTFTGAVPVTVPDAVESEIQLILENATLVEKKE